MKEKLLTQLIQPVIEDLGFVLWGVEYLPQKNNAILRVYIDHENGVGVDDCARCSHEISGLLEVEDPIKSAYVLEVSSPGMDRVLFSSEQFADYVGEHVQVKLAQPVDGARNIKGTIKSVSDEMIVVANEVTEYGFEMTNVMKARLKPQVNNAKFGGVKK
ncbi:ribosome maturation factor RimP [Marinicella sp. S1101]|uniref:ribosome maturation factor RimP n=1 Tax=Marinicella marina TaxID=2996016 RepID=UPI002260A62A|nr:ribosome maturation factor RimP [Marinicella marina]MCX7552845.1 ribosome maturation factor RimP [Marinicella marina]MDJ1139846.1 ribosome maturation factor RimP [Marinicella marina]